MGSEPPSPGTAMDTALCEVLCPGDASEFPHESYQVDGCYGLNCVPFPNSYAEALPPKMMVFGEEAFRR